MSNIVDLNNLICILKEGVMVMGLVFFVVQIDKLMVYQVLLVKWNKVYNLMVLCDLVQMVMYYLFDLFLVVLVFVGVQCVLDVGVGGGLLGIVLVIWVVEVQLQMQIILVDMVFKKIVFFNQVKV